MSSNLIPNLDSVDQWNDSIGVLVVHSTGLVQIHGLFVGTTEPGKFYTNNPMNKNGAAYVKTDTIHRNIWQIGTHINQPNCLIQTGAEICVNRDFNRDGVRNDKTECGFFGINFHSTLDRYNPSSVGKWSAGCIVVQEKSQHQSCIGIIKGSTEYKSNDRAKFSLILLDGRKI